MTFIRLVSIAVASAALSGSAACAQEDAGASAAEAPAAPEWTMEDVTAAPDEWREVEADNLLVFETNKGRIIIEMLPEAAPKTVEQFRAIAMSGDFDGTVFHRVIDDFMAQGGDIRAAKGRDSGLPDIPGEFTFRRNPSEMAVAPKGKPQEATQGLYKGFPVGTQSEYLAEMTRDGSVDTWVMHCPGVVSTARTSDPDSANSQFFLMRYKADHLDKSYTAWGRALEGLDVIRAIKTGPKPGGTPIEDPDVLEEAYMVSELPEDEQPEVWVQRTDTRAWKDKLDAAAQLNSDICNVQRVPAVIKE